MSQPAIRVADLGKSYRLGRRARHTTLREIVAGAVTAPFRRRSEPRAMEQLWALRDVTFDVAQGEVLGLVGRNGAGKSTLLKILSRIVAPTIGRAEIHGRVGSLLEVGTGFHSELTGRENIFLNGAVLGMRQTEVRRKFDEIVAFAETEQFLDTPVKHYSSGMYMRLAFAVAAHLETQILLVDEVLAVGDAAFQRKCIGKMGDVAHTGRTVLFVSHNMAAVERLCQSVVWLDGGRVVEAGRASPVVSRYLQTSFSSATERVWPDRRSAPGNDRVRVHRASVRPLHGGPADPITIRTPFVIEFDYWNLQPETFLNVSLHVYNEQGIMIFNGSPLVEPAWHGRAFPAGLFRSTCRVPGDLMNTGVHRVELLLVKDQTIIIHQQPDVLAFQVLDDVQMRQDYHGKWPGVVRPLLEWNTQHLGGVETPVAFGGGSSLSRTGLDDR